MLKLGRIELGSGMQMNPDSVEGTNETRKLLDPKKGLSNVWMAGADHGSHEMTFTKKWVTKPMPQLVAWFNQKYH